MPMVIDSRWSRTETSARRPCGSPPAPGFVEATLALIPLRDYQEAAFRALVARISLKDRSRTKVVALPTGTGKTRVGIALAVYLMKTGHSVLWVCKRWGLVRMAADEVGRLVSGLARSRRRLGGKRELVMRPVGDEARGQIIFTTLQTWYAGRGRLPAALAASGKLAVIWDEVHWGFASDIGRTFRDTYHGKSPVFGLSATPPESAGAEVVYSRSPEEFFGTVLATPEFEQVATEVDWTPDVDIEDFTAASVRVLANSRQRNDIIVDKVAALLAEGRAKSILLFAADVPHAAELARLISQRGVPARAVHCKLPPREQDDAVDLFRAGKLDVLVNVDQLAEGFDHPPVDAVLLTRPTKSQRRWVQMVGRGARRAEGKDTFQVIDFADNLTRFGENVVRAADVFPTLVRAEACRPLRLPVRYSMPPDVPQFVNYTMENYGAVPVALKHKFGVEMELTSSSGVPPFDTEWTSVADMIIRQLEAHVEAPVHPVPLSGRGGPLTHWRVTFDASAGWEVVSPILEGTAGFDELRRACDAIAAAVKESRGKLRINFRTGLHVTLATRLDTGEKIRGFVRLVQRVEPGLFTLVAPSRLYKFNPATKTYARRAGNGYCRPLRGLGDPDTLDLDSFVADHDNRYHTVNLTKSMDAVPLLEVRMHSGTFEFNKIALWVSLCMQLFNVARYREVGPARPGLVLPGRNRRIALADAAQEDIVALLKAEGVVLPPELERLLVQRRRELRPAWEKVLPNRVAQWAKADFYGGHPVNHIADWEGVSAAGTR